MTTESQPLNQSNSSSTHMQGWIKLMETYRKGKPSSQTNSKPKLNHHHSSTKQINSSTTSKTTNGSRAKSPEPIRSTITIHSPPNIFSAPPMSTLASASQQIIEDIPAIEIEPITPPRCQRDITPSRDVEPSLRARSLSPSSTDSNLSSLKRSKKKFVIHKSTKSTDISPPITEDISDDDIPLIDIRKQKMKSIDTLTISIVTDSIIPLATDLQSLPGHNQNENRDVRFLSYTDVDSLASHFQTCLYVDQKSLQPTKQYIFKSRTNVLNKIFKIDFYKTFRRNLALEKKSVLFNSQDNHHQQPLSIVSSPTSTSFKTDWTVNQRNRSSAQRNQPTNIFHVLQTNPKSSLNARASHSSTDSAAFSSHSKGHIQAFERIKDLLARTYYPHLHTAIECGYQFGTKSIFPNTHQLITRHDDTISIKQMPESPYFTEDATTITFRSPATFVRRNSILDQSITPNAKVNCQEETSSTENHDLSSLVKESVVVLTPTRIPSPALASPRRSPNHRKRRASNANTANSLERKKKRVVTSPSVEINNHFEEISNSESESNNVPPKTNSIRNGLRSHISKRNSKTPRTARRYRQSSSSIPSISTTLVHSDDEERGSISTNHSQFPHQKKKSNQPKQKQPSPYKKLTRNVYTDQLKQKLLANYSSENASVCECKPPGTCEDDLCLNKRCCTECFPTCACGTKCSNQKIRKGHWFKHLEVFDTEKYGQGLRTTTPVNKGTFLCEYVGEIITEEKFAERMINLYSKDEHHYTMKLTQNLVIDAYRMGSVARFANHSCSPNCEFQKWTVDGLQRMCMFALRNIKAGEELTYDYNFQSFNLQAQQPCYCENAKCRGTIGSKPNLANQHSSASHGPSLTMQRMTPRERRMILTSSIFLLRNLRKVREKYRLRKKNAKLRTAMTTKPPTTPEIFFTQNFFHPNLNNNNNTNKSTLASLRKIPKMNPRELFYLFYNFIRRSHFVKTERYQNELIDATCYSAQLAQLTLILNEIFALIDSYKCEQSEISPSFYLRKCPSKRLFPVYYQIITRPIDLTMIKTKLDNGEYSSFELFEQDLDLLFQNAITYCGDASNLSQSIHELEGYFHQTIKNDYQKKFDLFSNMKSLEENIENLQTFENFVTDFHAREVAHGQIREILYNIIHKVDEQSRKKPPIAYKIVLAGNVNSHRGNRSKSASDSIVHCRCGSVYDESSLVQCYACQLWQHVSCVTITDPTRPYYCFECQPVCENDPLRCMKTNVFISATLAPLQTYDDNHSSFSTLTRSDGFVIRVNECYFVPKQDRKNIDRALTSPEYDILCVERLWIDDDGNEQAAGFYYIRPNETFHEPTRKFFPNEVFRFPSSNDSVPISSFVRSCFVLDIKTYAKGKPISDNSTRVLASDIFVCEFRVDKTARTFTRFKSKHFGINTKSYCFDNYVEKLTIRRDYQPYQKEVQQHSQHDNRLRLLLNSPRLTMKQSKEKESRLNGWVEQFYCHLHEQNGLASQQQQPRSTFEQIFGHSNSNSPEKIRRKRRTISLSSDDDVIELVSDTECQNSPKKRARKQRSISPRKRDEMFSS